MMLVVCNGNVKSGSTWLVQIVRAAGPWSPVPATWRNPNWKSPSIPDESFDAMIQSDDWKDGQYYCKEHWSGDDKYLKLMENSNIRVITSVRDIKDVLVSRYFHDFNRGKTVAQSVSEYYFKSSGKARMRNYINYHNFWTERPAKPPLMVRYEQLIENFDSEAGMIFDYIGHPISPSEMAKVKRQTSFEKLQQKNQTHFRKGIIGDWKNHFDQETLDDLNALCGKMGFSYMTSETVL
jgi:LPS sulfotransferase NodH